MAFVANARPGAVIEVSALSHFYGDDEKGKKLQIARFRTRILVHAEQGNRVRVPDTWKLNERFPK